MAAVKKPKHEEQQDAMETCVTDLTQIMKQDGIPTPARNTVADHLDRMTAEAKATLDDWKKKHPKRKGAQNA